MLVVLMVLTSLALAVTVSVWLVPPYLVLMVWILAPARAPRDHALASAEQGDGAVVSDGESLREPAESGRDFASQAAPVAAASSSAEAVAPAMADQEVVSDPEPVVMVKTKRGKGRGRKAKGGASVEPAVVSATWIQVGPGKFVRVESPSASVDAPAEPESPTAVVPDVVSEGESAEPLAPASPTAEDLAEDPLLQEELAAEVRPEPEDRSAIIEEPAARDEFIEGEPFTENVLAASADAEAWSQPLPEEDEVDLPEEELISHDLATEADTEFDDRSAIVEEPAASDEVIEEELFSDDNFPSPNAEAWSQSSLEQDEDSVPEEELVPHDLVAEADLELEDRSAIVEGPMVSEAPSWVEPIADDALTLSDSVEAQPQPSADEDANAEVEVSAPQEELHEPESRELATEEICHLEMEDGSAILEEPVAFDCDELVQDERQDDDSDFASFGVEALPRASHDVVETSELAGSPHPEWQLDETWVNDGACEEASASFDEAVAQVEEESDGPADVVAASASTILGEECSELGPVEPSGDQGIALDALDLGWTTEPSDLPLPQASTAVWSPALRTISSPSRSTGNAPFVSWRVAWPRVGRTSGRNAGTCSSGRARCSGPDVRVMVKGSRLRSRRGVRAYRIVCRTFPPRSPPAGVRRCRSEAGRGVRRRD